MSGFFGRKKRHPRRVTTPTILQVESAECGVVCLAAILGFYRRWVSVESLRSDCGVGRDGSNAANLLKAGRLHGLDAKGYRVEGLDFKRFRVPCILHWNFSHFVVLEGAGRNQFHINDPAQGRRTVGKEEFSRSFTGVLLTMEPGEKFEPCGAPPSWISSLAAYFSEVKLMMALVLLLGISLVIPGALIPLFSKIFIDDILIRQFKDWLTPLLCGMVSAGALQAVVTYFQGLMMMTLQTRLSVAMNSRFLQRAMELPLSFHAQRSPGEMAARPQLIDRVAQLVAGPLGMTAIGLMTAMAYFCIMLTYDVMLTLWILLIAVLNIMFFLWQGRQFQTLNQILVREGAQYAGASMQSLQLLPEIKATGAESMLFTQLMGHKAKWINQQNRLTIRRSLLESLPAFLQIATQALLLLIGGQRVMAGNMTLGVLIAFQGLMMQFMMPLQQMLGLFTELQETRGNLDRIEDITRHTDKEQVQWKLPDEPVRPLRPHLQVENLTFGYQPFSPPLFDGFSLEVHPGKWVALVGSSGSGKSTLASLIAGLHKPWKGSIKLGGVEIADIPRHCFRATLAMVDQRIVLFNSSINDNLTMWDTRIDEDQIVDAAKDAAIHDWIIRRQNGYDHKLNENGTNLSGGEKARIEITRAITTRAPFIILDEATAALDSILEQHILETIKKRCTAGIIISHRISAVKACDEIIVFHGGKVAQRGNHETLMTDAQGVYRQLVAEENR